MGSWNGTCMISNLPIICGDKVKLIFLHRPYSDENPLQSSAYCYPNGIFHVGAFALDAEYNDYGGVENIIKDINYELVEKYFKTKYKKIKAEGKELIEFTVEQIIEAIERGEFEVFSEGDVKRKKMAERVLKSYGDDDGSKDEWKKLASIDVNEKWRTPTYNIVMIRADVWDAICKEHKTEFWKDKEDRKSNDDYYQTAQEWVQKRFDKFIEHQKIIDGFKEHPEDFNGRIDDVVRTLSSFSNPISMDGYAGGNSLFMSDIYADAIMVSDNLDYFQKQFTEMIVIESFLSATRKGWMIVSGAGSQSENWNSYKLLNKIVDGICDENINVNDHE